VVRSIQLQIGKPDDDGRASVSGDLHGIAKWFRLPRNCFVMNPAPAEQRPLEPAQASARWPLPPDFGQVAADQDCQ
jgi:hypothetical protein